MKSISGHTWQLTITGQLMLYPRRALHSVSKSLSRGAAELQMGIRTCLRPGNFSWTPSITLARVTTSLASISLSFLLTSTTWNQVLINSADATADAKFDITADVTADITADIIADVTADITDDAICDTTADAIANATVDRAQGEQWLRCLFLFTMEGSKVIKTEHFTIVKPRRRQILLLAGWWLFTFFVKLLG